VLFTDGLIEGYDSRIPGSRLGEQGLYTLLEKLLADGLDAEHLSEAVLAEVRTLNGDELTDDVAFLMLSWDPV
jgi:serine phosphatase RsbU (regulator of sigma subunit)